MINGTAARQLGSGLCTTISLRKQSLGSGCRRLFESPYKHTLGCKAEKFSQLMNRDLLQTHSNYTVQQTKTPVQQTRDFSPASYA